MDGQLVKGVDPLPMAVTGDCEFENYHSLAVRDLQCGQGIGLPSGEAAARFIGSVPLTAEQVGLTAAGCVAKRLCGTRSSARQTSVPEAIGWVRSEA